MNALYYGRVATTKQLKENNTWEKIINDNVSDFTQTYIDEYDY